MEEDDITLRAIAEVDGSVDAQVHIAVNGRIVMADKQPPGRREQRSKGGGS
jgi:hypothetical protein